MTLDEQRTQMRHKFQTVKWKHHQCGHGSVYGNTAHTRDLLSRIARKYSIKTVSDAGAGDLSWVGATDWNVQYTPYDIRKWHPDIIEFDITKDVLPKTDLIICRHVLNHLTPELSQEARDRFQESGSTYLFMTCTKIGYIVDQWGYPLEFEKDVNLARQTPKGSMVWNYGLWRMNQ